jgi:hypothetical protein
VSPGFQYDAPLGVRLSDPNYLRHHIGNMATVAQRDNKPALARELRQQMGLCGEALLRVALSAANAVRS